MATKYNILVEQGEDGYLIAEVVELPGCRTQARTQEDFIKRIKEAIKGYLRIKAKDEPTTLRELMEKGKIYFAIMEYKEGKISIGKAAEIAGISLSEMMDLLAKLGIKSNMEVEDYLEGEKVAEEIFE